MIIINIIPLNKVFHLRLFPRRRFFFFTLDFLCFGLPTK